MAEAPADPATTGRGPSRALVTLLATATGALVANLYYAQPLVAPIGRELGISADLAGSVVSLTQIGYGAGLFLIVSLADLVENRRLVLTTLAATAVALAGAAVSSAAAPFFLACFVIGLCSTGAQVLVPYAAHLVPEQRRGRIIGNVMGGLLTGIMLARPAALFVAASFGWRAVFWGSAALMVAIWLALARMMPDYVPRGGHRYGRNIASMIGLLASMPVLRRRAAYQALMFAAFSMFWTAVPIMLAHRFGMSERGIALFAFAGVGGAAAAPLAGRLADRGLTPIMTPVAMAVMGLAFYATAWAAAATALIAMVALAVAIDAAVQTNQIISQRLIYAVPAESRGRVNAIYMTLMFAGGAIGSLLGTLTYEWGGWRATAETGGLIGLVMLLLLATEAPWRRRGASGRQAAD